MVRHPFFYIDKFDEHSREKILDDETSRHIVQVLRMKKGEQLNLTDGIGHLITASIIDDHKKHCVVAMNEVQDFPKPVKKTSIGISLLKNTARFEWFLEKATELGINEVIPLICQRTEKQKFRTERMRGIAVSAMLQSQQVWLPLLHEPIAYELLFRQEEIAEISQKFIAHCVDDKKTILQDALIKSSLSQLALIGPEGDFAPDEIEQAIGSRFIPVSLGETRLRSETAALVAAVLMTSV
jgi:16S rRNA (uracil1498-N3)-methyltransferase